MFMGKFFLTIGIPFIIIKLEKGSCSFTAEVENSLSQCLILKFQKEKKNWSKISNYLIQKLIALADL